MVDNKIEMVDLKFCDLWGRWHHLTAGDAFREEMIRQRIDFKRNQEYYAVRNRPHPYEMSLYFDV